MNFRLVERPALYPGVSLFQLLSPRGFVDTGVEMPVGGRVYLEEVAVNEAAVLFGYTDPETTEKLRGVILSQGNELAALRAKLSDLDPVLKALKNLAAEAPLAGVAL